MTTSDAIALTALGISIIALLLNLWRYSRHPRIEVSGVELLGGGGETVYLLIGLAVRNNSTMPITVSRLVFQPLDEFRIVRAPSTTEIEKGIVTWPSMGLGMKTVQMRLEDTFPQPFDIEPLHSRLGHFILAISPVPLSRFEHPSTTVLRPYCKVVAQNHKGKKLCQVKLSVPWCDS